jgi:uncharacterized protein with HEPN domain
MLDPARTVLGWTAGLSLAEYEHDDMLPAAVERNLEIIGQAACRLSQHDPEAFAALTDLPQTDAVRYLLGHEYYEADSARAWEVIEHVLPVLVAKIEERLPDVEIGTIAKGCDPGGSARVDRQ